MSPADLEPPPADTAKVESSLETSEPPHAGQVAADVNVLAYASNSRAQDEQRYS